MCFKNNVAIKKKDHTKLKKHMVYLSQAQDTVALYYITVICTLLTFTIYYTVELILTQRM